VWPRQGRGKGVASPARRGSTVRNPRPRGARASGMGGYGVGEGDLAIGWLGHYPLERLAGRHR
jgi:hypothetical protein